MQFPSYLISTAALARWKVTLGSRKPFKRFPFPLSPNGHRAKATVLMKSEANLNCTSTWGHVPLEISTSIYLWYQALGAPRIIQVLVTEGLSERSLFDMDTIECRHDIGCAAQDNTEPIREGQP